MYVILTSKPGVFHSEVKAPFRIVESYEYRLYGVLKAIFHISVIEGDAKVRIIEDEPPYIVNDVSSRFLEKFASLELARNELRHLTTFGSIEAELVLCTGAIGTATL